MELVDQMYKFSGAAKSLEEYPQRFSVDGVKRLPQVYEDCVQVLILLFTLLLHLTNRNDHVYGAAIGAEATLCLWQVLFTDRRDQAVEDDVGQDFSSDGVERDASVVPAVGFAALVLVEGNN